MTLRVVLDAFALGQASGASGIGTYQRQLLTALAARHDLDVAALASASVRLPGGVTRIPIRRRAPGRFAVQEHDLLLPLSFRHLGKQSVFHSAAPYAPRVPPRRPWVQTLYDLIPLVFDDPGLAASRRRLGASASAYRKANAVIAISRHAADEGLRHFALDPARVHVVHLAPGPEFAPGPVEPADPPYVLLVGGYDPRKGYKEAFAVAANLAAAGYPHRLCVAGSQPEWLRPVIDDLRHASGAAQRVELLGFVADLPALYRAASAVVITSRYEGFGLPVLEAMACGVPVVAFANSSLPEVVGDAGLLVSDGDVPAFVEALRRVLDEPSLATDLSARGRERAKHFNWERVAAQHVEVYGAIANS